MSKVSRSARGQRVDFDLLAVKQQLAAAPVPVSVDDRRRFIDEKDGIRVKQIIQPDNLPSALSIAVDGIEESVAALQPATKPEPSSKSSSKKDAK